ncbi:MAG: AMP-binding protein [Burkholderiales bacterium]
MNVTEPIRRHARLAPAAAAYLRRDLSAVTYAEFERTLDALAHRIRGAGLRAGQSAAFGCNDHYRNLALTLALARVGVACAPLSLPADLTDVAIVDDGIAGNGCDRVVALADLWPPDLLDATAAGAAAIERDASLTFANCPSSGTTGAPKFIPVSHALAARRVFVRQAASQFPAPLRQVCYVHPATWYGVSSLLRVLWQGGTIAEPNTEAGTIGDWLARSRINYMVASPIALQKVAANAPFMRGPYALSTIEVAGSALPRFAYDLARARLCANILCAYGSTESSGAASAPVSVMGGAPGTAGYPWPGVEIEVVDADDRPLPAGREGLVRIRSELNAGGYLADPAATARVFRGEWVYPGDLGKLAPDGLLTVTGRTDDVINRGGDKVSPHAVEEAMMALAPLREVAVFGVADGTGSMQICAAIVPEAPLAAEPFHASCRDRLGAHAPVMIMHMRALPRNDNGKVLRDELVAMALAAGAQQAARPTGATLQ